MKPICRTGARRIARLGSPVLSRLRRVVELLGRKRMLDLL